MKDKLILIISIVLVVLGVVYLGYTSYRFFSRSTNSNTTNNNKEQTATLSMVGGSNKELIAEDLTVGSNAKISIELQNKSNQRVSEVFEGRVYKVKEVNFFPALDSEIPVDSKQVSATVNANLTQTFDYVYKTTTCGNYYIALADKDFWAKGRGKSVYGFFSVKCENAVTPTITVTPVVNGASTATKSPLANNNATQLPKSGPEDILFMLGIVSVMAGLAFRLKVANVK